MTVHPIPSLTRRPFGALIALVALIGLTVQPARADVVNVSAFVLGTRAQVPPVLGPATPTYPCGAACLYAGISKVGADAGYVMEPAPYTASSWPPVYTAALPAVGAVDETLGIPAPPSGVVTDGGAIGAARLARVQYDWTPLLGGTRMMGVQSWKGGSGVASVSIAIRITPAADKKYHYLEFVVPRLARQWQEAAYVGGPSGNQPIQELPQQMQSRSAVDVYIDGLPVWSGESTSLKPQGWSPPAVGYLDLDWGPDLDESRVTLFLGALPLGVTRTVALVFRTDLRVAANTCYTSNMYGTSAQRCDSRREALTLPSMLSGNGGPLQLPTYRPDVRVYTL